MRLDVHSHKHNTRLKTHEDSALEKQASHHNRTFVVVPLISLLNAFFGGLLVAIGLTLLHVHSQGTIKMNLPILSSSSIYSLAESFSARSRGQHNVNYMEILLWMPSRRV